MTYITLFNFHNNPENECQPLHLAGKEAEVGQEVGFSRLIASKQSRGGCISVQSHLAQCLKWYHGSKIYWLDWPGQAPYPSSLFRYAQSLQAYVFQIATEFGEHEGVNKVGEYAWKDFKEHREAVSAHSLQNNSHTLDHCSHWLVLQILALPLSLTHSPHVGLVQGESRKGINNLSLNIQTIYSHGFRMGSWETAET